MGLAYFKINHTYSTLVLKIHTKKIRQTRKIDSFHKLHMVERKNEARKLKSEKTRVCAQKPRPKMPFKNSISGPL
jgi:hypothetical protein